MKKSTFDSLNIELDKLEYIKDVLQSETANEKITEVVSSMRALLNEEFLMGATNRRDSKTMRTNFVKNNPSLLDAAKKIIHQPLTVPLKITGLFDDKYLRVVVTFVKEEVPDFKYFTYEMGGERMLVKVSGTIPAEQDKGEQFDPQF